MKIENVNEKAVMAMFELKRRVSVKYDSGWKLVQKILPNIVEYGRSEGIIQLHEKKVKI